MPSGTKIGYVLKRYPRLSETFIVNEILAHEAAGLAIDIFSVRPPVDGRFHRMLSRVQAPVTYVPSEKVRAEIFWNQVRRAADEFDLDGDWLFELLRTEEARDVHQAILLARLVRERGIEHLHAHFATVATSVARLAAALAGIGYSFTAHANDIFHESVCEDALRRKLRDAAAVVTVSDFNLRDLRDRFGADADAVRRIYNGLDLELFPYASPTERAPLIVGVGRLVPKKGFDVLIEACALLAERNRPFHCEIIGDGELQGDLERLVEARGVADRVTLRGAQPMEEVIERIGQAAVVAAPCVVADDGNRDGLPTVILETMALGTPCVSTDVTGIPEIVRDGTTGLLVPQGDAAALAAAIERLLDDATLREHLAKNARDLVTAEFDIHRNTAAARKLFAAGAAGAAPAPLALDTS